MILKTKNYIFDVIETRSSTASTNLSCERIKNFVCELGRDHGNWHGASRNFALPRSRSHNVRPFQ